MTEIEKNLATLAERINAEHRACETAATAAVGHAMNAGEHLAAVKVSLAHGGFLPWLSANFEGSRRTASTYIRLADNREALNEKRASHSIRGALKELSSPLPEKPEPVDLPVEEPGDPMTTLFELLASDEDEWYDSERDVPLTKADVEYLVRAISEEPAVGRVAAVLFFGEDPGGMPRLNPHGVRDPRIAVLIGRVLQECGPYTYGQLFEQVERTDTPLVRHDRTQLEYILDLGRKGETDAYTADLVAMVGSRYKLINSVAQLSYIVDLAKSGVSDEEVLAMVRATGGKKTIYAANGWKAVAA